MGMTPIAENQIIMTRRDELAIVAVKHILGESGTWLDSSHYGYTLDELMDRWAAAAYCFADAMEKARAAK